MALSMTNVILAISTAGSLAVATLQPAKDQPSTPRPANANPQPANPTPRPSDPNPRPQRPSDGRPGEPIPAAPNRQPDSSQIQRERTMRPFGLSSPDMESRFVENARRLDAAERRLGEMNADLTRRLQTVRTLPAESQTGAVLDLLEQMLEERVAMQKYLVQSRTMWTGDLGEIPAAEPSNPPTQQRSPSSAPEIPPVRSPR